MDATASVIGCAEGGIPFNIARDRILNLVTGLLGVEDVPSSECMGRVAAEHVLASDRLPRFDQSAMDGYAVRCADVMPGTWLPVAGRTAAGEVPGRLPLGGALRIMTGAPLPFGADTVIAQEDTSQQGGMLRAVRVPPMGANVRRRGEDIELGQMLVTAGTRLDWRHVTVLAAQGRVLSRCAGSQGSRSCQAGGSFEARASVSRRAKSMTPTCRCCRRCCAPAARSSTLCQLARMIGPRCAAPSGVHPLTRVWS